MSLNQNTNELIFESSPYLLQHAHNPVAWKAWSEKTLLQARKENKLLLISIGYATCHWCHVMEEESFENKEVAAIMNQYFICIKVDREERPDIDQIYMDAVQLLTGRGGWPLHSIALPDGKPFWGGTYFPKENWMNILKEIARIWQEEPEKIHEYAENLTHGIKSKDILPVQNTIEEINPLKIKNIIEPWKQKFDLEWGGMNRPPKFPLPNNYHFLLRFAIQAGDDDLLKFVVLSLTKMAYGGIYDHIGGGFSRYSTDHKWHVPHFEKMLYDNAQMVSLFSDAYLITKNPLFKEVVEETLKFVETELYDNLNGGFFSALDADSMDEKGKKVEGAFYVWTEKDLKQILKDEFDLFSKYFNINKLGLWEEENYVLIKNQSDNDFCTTNLIDKLEFKKIKNNWKNKLAAIRSHRPKPLLDDKILTSWNALMIKGYCDAFRVFGNQNYLMIAKKSIAFLLAQMLRPDGGLNRNFKNENSKTNAFIEDYATTIDALISFYELTFEEIYLIYAKQLTDYVLEHFLDTESGFFFYTSDEDVALINRKIDIPDDVIPSGNSIMAKNLNKLSHIFHVPYYEELSNKMLQKVFPYMHSYASNYTNWLFLATDKAFDYYEVVISGPDAKIKLNELNQYYIPNILKSGSEKISQMPLLVNRFDSKKTRIFVCVDNTCLIPVDNIFEALKQIKTHF